jgi:hypothetical protein
MSAIAKAINQLPMEGMHPSDKEALANMIADYFDDYGKFCNMEC